MLCPDCSYQLLPLSLSTPRGTFVVDYCQRCAGVWSEREEINFLNLSDLSPLINILPRAPVQSDVLTHLCPKDREILEVFRGQSVPMHLSIFRCPTCTGFWFPNRSVIDFKRAQYAKTDYFKLWNIPLPSVHDILLPVLVFIILGGGFLVTYVSVQHQQETRTQAKSQISKPLVLFPEADQVVISFNTQTPAITKLRYWTRADTVSEQFVSATAKTTHTIILKNLERDKKYSYQLVLEGTGEQLSEIYTFTTE